MRTASDAATWPSTGTRRRSPTTLDAVRPYTTKELALRKKNQRAHTTNLLVRLELLAPSVGENKGPSKAGLRIDDLVLDESE